MRNVVTLKNADGSPATGKSVELYDWAVASPFYGLKIGDFTEVANVGEYYIDVVNSARCTILIDSAVKTSFTGVWIMGDDEFVPDGSVSTAKLADDAVTTVKILDGAVLGPKIGLQTIDDSRIAADAVTTAKIAANAVTTDEINNGAVTEVKLAQTVADSLYSAWFAQKVQLSDLLNEQTLETGTAPLLNPTSPISWPTFSGNVSVEITAKYQERGVSVSTDPTISSGNVTFGLTLNPMGSHAADGNVYFDIMIVQL